MSTYLNLHGVTEVSVTQARFLKADGYGLVFVQELVINTKHSGTTKVNIYLEDPAKAIPVQVWADEQTA